jgi:hypothetical protein
MTVDPKNPLAVELQQEMTVSYFAACRKMVDALEALNGFDKDLSSSARSIPQAALRAKLLAHARERVFYVVIQREAMKLPTLDHFFESYEIPDEVRYRLGPIS